MSQVFNFLGESGSLAPAIPAIVGQAKRPASELHTLKTQPDPLSSSSSSSVDVALSLDFAAGKAPVLHVFRAVGVVPECQPGFALSVNQDLRRAPTGALSLWAGGHFLAKFDVFIRRKKAGHSQGRSASETERPNRRPRILDAGGALLL